VLTLKSIEFRVPNKSLKMRILGETGLINRNRCKNAIQKHKLLSQESLTNKALSSCVKHSQTLTQTTSRKVYNSQITSFYFIALKASPFDEVFDLINEMESALVEEY
jgi:hypothetical protein